MPTLQSVGPLVTVFQLLDGTCSLRRAQSFLEEGIPILTQKHTCMCAWVKRGVFTTGEDVVHLFVSLLSGSVFPQPIGLTQRALLNATHCSGEK